MPEVVEIHYEEGFAAVKALAVALDRALLGHAPMEIRVRLSPKSRPTGFREKILASDALRGMLDLLEPCLANHPHVRVERSES